MNGKKRSKLTQIVRELLFGGRGPDLHEDRLLRLIEINTALNSELNLKRLLTLVLDSVIELTGAERGFIIIRRNDKNAVEVARNIDREEIRKAESKVSSSIINRVMSEGAAVITESAMEDHELSLPSVGDSIPDSDERPGVLIGGYDH